MIIFRNDEGRSFVNEVDCGREGRSFVDGEVRSVLGGVKVRSS